jgi:hypothetical protein
MNIRSIINEEIADYIKKISSQKDDVKQTVDSFESEEEGIKKMEKGIRAEESKQKLYKLEAEFLKEKVLSSKQKQSEYKARIEALRNSNI